MAAPIKMEFSSNFQKEFDFFLCNERVETMRTTEFERLDGIAYLDHTGATLYSKSQIEAYQKDLLSNVYGNPHSHHPSSQLTTDVIEQVRYRVLQHFNTTPDKYTVIFTSGATSALKLLAESFDFTRDSTEESKDDTNSKLPRKSLKDENNHKTGCFCYIQDNHTSVIGMREIVIQRGLPVLCFDESDLKKIFPSVENSGSVKSDTAETLNSYKIEIRAEKISTGPQSILPNTKSTSTDTQNILPKTRSTSATGPQSILPTTQSNTDPQSTLSHSGSSSTDPLSILPNNQSACTALPKNQSVCTDSQSILPDNKSACTDDSQRNLPNNQSACTDSQSNLPNNQSACTDDSQSILPHNQSACTDSQSKLPHNQSASTDSQSILPNNQSACTNCQSNLPNNQSVCTDSQSILPYSRSASTNLQRILPSTRTTSSNAQSSPSNQRYHCPQNAESDPITYSEADIIKIAGNQTSGHCDSFTVTESQNTSEQSSNFTKVQSSYANDRPIQPYVISTNCDTEGPRAESDLTSRGSAEGQRSYAKDILETALIGVGGNCITVVDKVTKFTSSRGLGNGLFVYPPQSNFSGQKYPLAWVKRLHQGATWLRQICKRWYVVLDAATYVSTNRLNLDEVEPDFVTVSFYKIFGFPTGIGALLVKNPSSHLLKKTYFGGGTVLVNLSKERYHIPRPELADRFEDGTLPFLDILALSHGFDALERIGGSMEAISFHTFHLAKYVYTELKSLHHPNGAVVAELYTGEEFTDPSRQGNIVNFNLLRSDGSCVGFSQVDRLAQLHKIHLRTGCFCNMGACQKFLGLTSQHIKDNFEAGHVCGDNMDLLHGKPTGSVRISFGYMSTLRDAQVFIQFIEDCFVEKSPIQNESLNNTEIKPSVFPSVKLPGGTSLRKTKDTHEEDVFIMAPNDKSQPWFDYDDSYVEKLQRQFHHRDAGMLSEDAGHVLTGICLYPVKSCASLKVTSWEMGSTGLKYDRGWMIVNQSGTCLSQKREPRLCLIKPYIDVEEELLVLTMEGQPNLYIPIAMKEETPVEGRLCQTRVCGDKIKGLDCGKVASDWLSTSLDRPDCHLIQQYEQVDRPCKLMKDTGVEKASLSFTNESQFLLVNRRSCQELESMMESDTSESCDGDLQSLIDRFRANFIISTPGPFEEDSWSELTIGEHTFQSLGVCNRCQMICLDQETGRMSKEPLLTLSRFRGNKVTFGIHLKLTSPTCRMTISVGDPLSSVKTPGMEF